MGFDNLPVDSGSTLHGFRQLLRNQHFRPDTFRVSCLSPLNGTIKKLDFNFYYSLLFSFILPTIIYKITCFTSIVPATGPIRIPELYSICRLHLPGSFFIVSILLLFVKFWLMESLSQPNFLIAPCCNFIPLNPFLYKIILWKSSAIWNFLSCSFTEQFEEPY